MKHEILTVVRKMDNNFKYDPEKYPNNYILMGGDNSNPTWYEYINNIKKPFQKYFKVLGAYCKDKEGYYQTTGQDQDQAYFEFSDSVKIAFTWRAWGDFMQALVNKNEGYMTYYM